MVVFLQIVIPVTFSRTQDFLMLNLLCLITVAQAHHYLSKTTYTHCRRYPNLITGRTVIIALIIHSLTNLLMPRRGPGILAMVRQSITDKIHLYIISLRVDRTPFL